MSSSSTPPFTVSNQRGRRYNDENDRAGPGNNSSGMATFHQQHQQHQQPQQPQQPTTVKTNYSSKPVSSSSGLAVATSNTAGAAGSLLAQTDDDVHGAITKNNFMSSSWEQQDGDDDIITGTPPPPSSVAFTSSSLRRRSTGQQQQQQQPYCPSLDAKDTASAAPANSQNPQQGLNNQAASSFSWEQDTLWRPFPDAFASQRNGATNLLNENDAAIGSDDDDDADSLNVILRPDTHPNHADFGDQHNIISTSSSSMPKHDKTNHLQYNKQDECHNLHVSCQSARSHLDLQHIVQGTCLETASIVEGSTGRTPLHVLSENGRLAQSFLQTGDTTGLAEQQRLSLDSSRRLCRSSSSSSSQIPRPWRRECSNGSSSSTSTTNEATSSDMVSNTDIADVVVRLWSAYPPAMMTADHEGCIPFEKLLRDWVNDCYRCENDDNDNDTAMKQGLLQQSKWFFGSSRSMNSQASSGTTGNNAAPGNATTSGSNNPRRRTLSSSILPSSFWDFKDSVLQPSRWLPNGYAAQNATGSSHRTLGDTNIATTPSHRGNGGTAAAAPLSPPDVEAGRTGRTIGQSHGSNATTVQGVVSSPPKGSHAERALEPPRDLPQRRVHVTAKAMYSIQMLSMLLDCMDQEAAVAVVGTGTSYSTPATTSSGRPTLVQRGHAHSAPLSAAKHRANGNSTGLSRSGKTLRSATSGSRNPDTKQQGSQSLQDKLQSVTMQDASASIVQSIASIPDLIKTILFMEDSLLKEQLLETTLIRRVLTSTYSIGRWLTGLIQSPEPRASHLALEYLHLVSSDNYFSPTKDGDDDLWSSGRSSRHDLKRTASPDRKHDRSRAAIKSRERLRDDFYHEVSRLQDFVPSLLSLSEKQIEEAATTRIVQQVLDRVISRPFAVMVIFCDALFLALLIFGYRRAVNGVLLGRARGTILWHVFVANMGTFYFVLREIGKAISLCMISSRRVRVYWTVWSVIDLVTTLLALVSTVVLRSPHNSGLRNLCAVTTGFMWLRVLSYLKGINMQLATFVLAILQIAKDLLWFMVILCIVVVLFSQMLFTLLAPEECSVDDAMRDSQDCSQSEYYLKVYAIFLGDFGLFDRKSFVSVFSLVLAVLYTFCASVVLLNVLIAIASDSYEKCLIRSANLFGRARVLMLAELVFFQNLLRRRIPPIQTPSPTPAGTWRWMDSFPAAKGWSGGSVVFSVLSLLSIVSWTIGDFAGSYLFGEGYGNAWMSLGSLLVNASILSGIILCLSASASDGNGWKGDNDDDESKAYAEWYSQYFQSFMLLLLGSSGAKAKSNGAEQQWQGRLLFLQDKMSSFAAETRNECDARMRSIESRIEESEARIRGEISAMELRWQSRQDANERLDDAVSQLLHLMRHHGHGLRNVGD